MVAVNRNHEKLVKDMLKIKKEVSPMQKAVKAAIINKVVRLPTVGSDIHGEDDVKDEIRQAAKRKERMENLEEKWYAGHNINFQKGGNGPSAVFLAVKNGNYEMVKLLEQAGANLNVTYQVEGST